MNSKYLFFILLIMAILNGFIAVAQVHDDTLSIPSVTVEAPRYKLFLPGNQTTEIDSLTRAIAGSQSLADLLSEHSTFFIKSYGAGSSATIASRGTEPRHTAIMWNGFNINSPSLGLSDLSIIPSTAGNQIALIHGGASPVYGNAALGGMILIDNKISTFEKKFQVLLNPEIGSFGNKNVNAQIQIAGNHLESRSSVYYQESLNDFPYINFAKRDKPNQKLSNAQYHGFGFMQDFDLKISKTNIITTGVWYQTVNRHIPPAMTVPDSKAVQHDSTLRTYLIFRHLFRKSALKISAAWFNEYQYYSDENTSLNTEYHVQNYLTESEWRYFLNDKIIFIGGLAANKSVAHFKEYDGLKNRISVAPFCGITFQPRPNWKINGNLRQEFTDFINPPISPSVGIEGKIFKNRVTLRANAGRNFNIPSMNELYWNPGGNENLKPETSWSKEIGFSYADPVKNIPGISITGFSATVDNWIKWVPVPGGYYSPDNLKQVQTKGIESEFDWKYSLNKLHFYSAIQYTWCRSTNSESYELYGEATIDKQLIYIPEHMIHGEFRLDVSQWYLIYNHSYVGKRFTESDNSDYLDAYQVADIEIGKQLEIKKTSSFIYFKVNNLFDQVYQVIAWRPTPGRWITAGLRINFNLHKNNS